MLTVSSAPTFGAKWLLQHLSSFSEEYPDINVRLDVRLELVDFERDGVDVGVRLGAGKYPGMRVDHCSMSGIVPVCHRNFGSEKTD